MLLETTPILQGLGLVQAAETERWLVECPLKISFLGTPQVAHENHLDQFSSLSKAVVHALYFSSLNCISSSCKFSAP